MVVISDAKDSKLAGELRKLGHSIFTFDVITSAILAQSVDLHRHHLDST